MPLRPVPNRTCRLIPGARAETSSAHTPLPIALCPDPGDGSMRRLPGTGSKRRRTAPIDRAPAPTEAGDRCSARLAKAIGFRRRSALAGPQLVQIYLPHMRCFSAPALTLVVVLCVVDLGLAAWLREVWSGRSAAVVASSTTESAMAAAAQPPAATQAPRILRRHHHRAKGVRRPAMAAAPTL